MKPFLLEPIHDYTIWGTNHISKARGIMKTMELGGKSVPTLIVQIKLLELVQH